MYVKDGAAKSKADFDAFSLEFAEDNAAGHSYNSSGVFITPDQRQDVRRHLLDRCGGHLHRDVQGLGPQQHHDIYVFGSTGTGTGTGTFT